MIITMELQKPSYNKLGVSEVETTQQIGTEFQLNRQTLK